MLTIQHPINALFIKRSNDGIHLIKERRQKIPQGKRQKDNEKNLCRAKLLRALFLHGSYPSQLNILTTVDLTAL